MFFKSDTPKENVFYYAYVNELHADTMTRFFENSC